MSASDCIKNEYMRIQTGSNFIPVPLCYQETEYTCGVTCVQSILARFGICYRQSTLECIFNSKPIIGTDPNDIVAFAQLLGFKASIYDDMKIEELKDYIIAGITPLIILQAWKDDEISYNFDWKNSHYIIICGYCDSGIYAMDPNVLGNYSYLSYTELFKRWHYADRTGKHYNRFGIIMSYDNCPVAYNPLILKPIE